MIKKIQSFYQQANARFAKQFGWFFTNSRKLSSDWDWLAR